MLRPLDFRPRRRGATALPPELAGRLRAIARRETLCRDVDRLWPELIASSPILEAAELAALERHVESCRRCASVVGWLAPAFVPPLREPLPPATAHRLRAIARTHRRPLPFYLGDVRFAAAASWILALALILVLGGPQRTAGRAVELVGTPIESAGRELGELDRYGRRLAGGLESGTRRVGENLGGGLRRLEAALPVLDWSELPVIDQLPARFGAAKDPEPQLPPSRTRPTDDGDRR